jgi:hypothetical protein
MLSGAAHVTYSVRPSAEIASPVGGCGMAMDAVTLRVSRSTASMQFPVAQATYKVLPSGAASNAEGKSGAGLSLPSAWTVAARQKAASSSVANAVFGRGAGKVFMVQSGSVSAQ